MSDLWDTLYDIAVLPKAEARTILKELKQEKLFPYQTLAACTIRKSYRTTRKDIVGRAFDWFFTHMNYWGGYFLMRLWFAVRLFWKKLEHEE